jgi:hypothetical protein
MTHTKGYEVTKDGQVYSIAHNWRGYGRRKLIQDMDRGGYLRVRLTIGGERRPRKVHQLVAFHHLSEAPIGVTDLRHLDGNKENNRADNLAWGTAQDNANDRELHGRTSRGESHSQAIKAGLAKNRKGQ